MKFLIINSNKLKIVINKEDIEKYGINFGSNEKHSDRAKKSLWRVLDAAEEECGFNASGERLLIQLYPVSDGGEIFVTKIGKTCAGVERDIALSQNVAMLSSKHIICRFNDVGEAIKFCRGLSEEAKESASSLYYSDDGAFYLVYDERSGSPLSELSAILEFSNEIPAALEPYVVEHSVKINGAEKAFRVLSEL